MNKLSLIIITYNEEKNIQRCIESAIDISDEIIVVDSFSTDSTELICKNYDVKFIKHAFEGHIQQKNWALKQSTNELILSLDADEALSESLKKRIQEIKKNPKYAAYKMNRLTNYCGKWIHHGSWYPDTKLRLAKKSLVEWGGENPHDKLMLHKDGEVKHIKEDILHYSYYSIAGHIEQQEKFSGIAAKAMFENGRKAPSYKLIVNPLASWVKDIIIRGGFLDGKSGFTVAWISAKSVYWKYSKLKKLIEVNSADKK